MNDLIDREKAIEDLQNRDPSKLYDIEDIEYWINSLPSVEPETPSNGSITSMNTEKMHDRTTGDLISRQAAIDALNEYFARIGKLKRRGLTEGEKAISLDTVGAIKTLRLAEPKRKTGKWITDTYGNIMCSECGWCAPQIMAGCLANKHLDYVKSNFCWHCGAYMRGESDE